MNNKVISVLTGTLIFLNSCFSSLMTNHINPVSQFALLVQKKEKELQSVLDALKNLDKDTKAAEKKANTHRNLAEQDLVEYTKFTAKRVSHLVSYPKDSAMKAYTTPDKILKEMGEISDYDKEIFDLRLKTSQLKKKLLKTEKELTKAEIQLLAASASNNSLNLKGNHTQI